MLVLCTGGHTNNSNYKFANQHSESAIDEESATTEFLNGIERDRGTTNVDEGGDDADQEWIADGPELLEEGGSELFQCQ